ncbi:hypothetical protein [Streptomyces sp. NPDC002491]
MNTAQPRLRTSLPLLAPPVHRDGWAQPSAGSAPGGVQAAKSACGGLTGPARQMCYSARYGVQV